MYRAPVPDPLLACTHVDLAPTVLELGYLLLQASSCRHPTRALLDVTVKRS